MAKKVLIVEDNELNMKLFHDLLDAQGYETLQTREGLQALTLARQHRPDLILMDIQLPEISGLEVTKWLKEDEELASIPIIAVSPLIWPNCRSNGVVTEEAITSGLAPGYWVATWIVGKSTAGNAEMGSIEYPSSPMMITPTIKSDVAMGR